MNSEGVTLEAFEIDGENELKELTNLGTRSPFETVKGLVEAADMMGIGRVNEAKGG